MNQFIFEMPSGERLYWRGPEETTEQAEKAITEAYGQPVFVERLK